MAYKLVIVESPAKAKTIEKYLGEGFKVVSSVGHIRDLAISGVGGLGVDLETMKPTYKVDSKKRATVKELKDLAKKADMIYLATDPDREGEAISWHLKDELKIKDDKYERVVFNEITKDAVTEAMKSPRKIDDDLVHSQESRRILDRIVGFKLSNLLRTRIGSRSAGRVQSVALKIIVDRENARNAFVPVEYYTINSEVKVGDKDIPIVYPAKDADKVKLTKDNANDLVKNLKTDLKVTKVEKKEVKGRKILPFTTSTLQQTASSTLGFNAKRTMRIAQQLYEGIDVNGMTAGLITYMRTDSFRMSPVFQAKAKTLIESKYGKEYLGALAPVANKKGAQDAHEAVRPTSAKLVPNEIKEQLTTEQYKLYKLIWERAMSALMASPIKDRTNITLEDAGVKFGISGSIMKFAGYTKVMTAGDKDVVLPELKVGDIIKSKKFEANRNETQPPARFGEASLIKTLEENGVGRPSTYATIISTIKDRGYVEMEKKSFAPTEQGEVTIKALVEHFNRYVQPEFTAGLEEELDEIAHGDTDFVAILKEFYENFDKDVKLGYENLKGKPAEEVGRDCPTCGLALVKRKSRYGEFVSCSGFPKCKYSEKESTYDPEKTGEYCPKCFSEIITRKNSKSGEIFKACSNFPKCKWTAKGDEVIQDTRPANLKK